MTDDDPNTHLWRILGEKGLAEWYGWIHGLCVIRTAVQHMHVVGEHLETTQVPTQLVLCHQVDVHNLIPQS